MWEIPALFTNTSSVPKRLSISLYIFLTSSYFETSDISARQSVLNSFSIYSLSSNKSSAVFLQLTTTL